MVPTNVLNGSTFGHAGASFARVTCIKKLGFTLGRAVVHGNRPQRTAPLEDQRIAAMFKDNGDAGSITVTNLNTEQLTQAYAAAYVLLRQQTRKINPSSGKVDEHIVKYLVGPTPAIVAALEFARDSSQEKSIAYAVADCVMLKVDPSARIAEIKARRALEVVLDITPHETYFMECMKNAIGKDEAELIDTVLEAMVDNDINPEAEFKNSIAAYMESQAKRARDGKYVRVDPDLYAMSLDGAPVVPAVVVKKNRKGKLAEVHTPAVA